MGDERGGIEAEMGNQHGAAAAKKRRRQRREEASEGNGELSDDDPNYQYVSIVGVNYESAPDDSTRQLIPVNSGDVLKCSVLIGESPPQENVLSRVSRVSVNAGDIPNGLSTDVDQPGAPNGSSSPIEKVSDSSSALGNGSPPGGHILNGSSTHEESLDLEDKETATNGSSLIEIVSDLKIPNSCESDNSVSTLVIDQGTPLSKSSSLTEIWSDSVSELPHSMASPVGQVSNGGSAKRESSDEDESSKSDAGGSPVVNGHSNGISSTDESPAPVERVNGVSTNVEESPKQNGLKAEDSLEERLARAVRETLEGLPVGVEMTDGLQEEVERVVREKLKRQRSGSSDCWNHEDSDDHCIVDFLDKINDHAEARLAAKRQARAEAREIRMRELERMQRESEDGDRVYDAYPSPVEAVNRCVRAGSVTTPRSLLSANNSYHSSRRSSEDSLEEVNSIRDARHELRELEEKFRKAMIANAQLDNEKASIAYQVDLFKDRYEELEEQNLQLTREHKETCRQLEQTKRHRTKLQEDLEVSRTQLGELLQLVQEKGLVVVEGDCSSSDEESEGSQPRPKKPPKKALVSADVADVLQQGSGSLDVRLKKFVEERNELLDELRRVKLELEEERAHSRGRHANGPTGDSEDIQREANKLLGDYKFKMQKAEQDVNTLQANVARLESQVVRYKSAAETSEKLEDELKLEKRKLQRELREAQSRVEELETSHSHLQRRLDKLKNAKSALLKDL